MSDWWCSASVHGDGDVWVWGRTWDLIHSGFFNPALRIHLVCSDYLAFYKIPLLSLFLSLLKGQQRPGCHPTLLPCSDSSLLHLSSHSYSTASRIPLPITYLNLGHQTPGCHPPLLPCSSSSLLHLSSHSYSAAFSIPLPVTYLNLGH